MIHDLAALANGPHMNGNPQFCTREGYRARPGQKRKDPLPQGHIMPPGTGPAGETCGSCQHLFRNVQAKTYLKCALYRLHWTGGRKTDVRLRDAACSKWAAA